MNASKGCRSRTFRDEVVGLLASLRPGGITGPFTDALIAAVVASSGLEPWTRDNPPQDSPTVKPRRRHLQEPP